MSDGAAVTMSPETAVRLAALRAMGARDDREWWDCCACCLSADLADTECVFNGTPNRHGCPCEDCEPEDYREVIGNA